jgi:hypothetical protein
MGDGNIFKPEVKTNKRQITIIIIIIIIFITVPLAYTLFRSVSGNPFETFTNLIQQDTADTNDPLMFTIPILNTEIDLTIFRENPQLLIFGGIALTALSVLIGITLIRSFMKEDKPKELDDPIQA